MFIEIRLVRLHSPAEGYCRQSGESEENGGLFPLMFSKRVGVCVVEWTRVRWLDDVVVGGESGSLAERTVETMCSRTSRKFQIKLGALRELQTEVIWFGAESWMLLLAVVWCSI